MKKPIRIISTKDLSLYKGVKLRSGQIEMQRIKFYYDKLKHQEITNIEAAEYYGIPVTLFEDTISRRL